MKSTMIVRPVDSNGRIVLPKHLLKDIFNANEDDKLMLEFFFTEDSIILKKFNEKCIFCDNRDDLSNYKGSKICLKCLKELKNI